jgi:hypothetical protein
MLERALWRHLKNWTLSQVWWHMPVILALGRLREKDKKFKTGLGYTAKGTGSLMVLTC